MNHNNKHTFACFFNEEQSSFDGHMLTCADKELYQRVINVLRLEAGDPFILFSDKNVYTGTLSAGKKNAVILESVTCEPVTPLKPSLTFVLPLLKKSNFEEALYAAAQMGVTEIIPFMCKKSQYKGKFEDERERMHAIMVAACEQAKQFVLPVIKSVVSVDLVASIQVEHKYLCDVEGKKVSEIFTQTNAKSLALSMGPEGGLADVERDIFIQSGWQVVVFTPSILRSTDMAVLGLGFLRSWYQ